VKEVVENTRSRNMLIGAVAGTALMLLAFLVAHGTLRMFGLGLVVTLSIPLMYFAIEKPLLFPFGLYAALVPFEDILTLGHEATINKILGILSCAAIFFTIVRRGRIVKPTPGVLAWMAVTAWMGISGFWAIDFQAWQADYVTFIENYLLYALLAMMITTIADIEMVSTCIVIGGLGAAAAALWPFMHGVNEGGRLILPSADRFHPPDPNRFAAALLLPIAVLFAATLSTRKTLSLAANLCGLGLLSVTVILTGSRAAMIAIGILFVYMVIRSRHRLSVYILIALAAVAAVPIASTIHSRWSIAVSTGGAGRADIWRVAVIAFKDHWAIGSGFGSFPAAFDAAVLRAPLHMYIGWHRAPHDMIISTAVQLGVVGLVLLAIAWFAVFRDLAVPKLPGFLGDLKIGLEATLIALFVDAMFLDITDTKYLWLLFIMIAFVRSTIINTAAIQYRRRTVCAAPSSLTPVPPSAQEKLLA
jgi:hypothetical protein